MQNTAEQNYSGSVTDYDTRPGNEVGLFYNELERVKFKLVYYYESKDYSDTLH